jgi:transposase-like protein
MDTYGVDLMGRRRRRRHSAEFKAAVIAECMRPGVSVAAVALAHSLNANMLRKWVIDAEHAAPPRIVAKAAAPEPDVPLPGPTFIPLALTAPAVEGDIRIEVHRSGTTVNVVWPAAAARECAAWLSEWLR